MILQLEVTGPEAEKLGAAQRKEFHARGGSIGRLPDNSWVLPDPYVSSRHALIRYQNGVFYIEDTSTNGVFINSPENRLIPGQPYALKSGDWIFIDPYEIKVVIGARPADPLAAALDSDPFGVGRPASPEPLYGSPRGPLDPPAPYGDVSPLDPLVPRAEGEDVDPLRLLGFDSKPEPRPNVPSAADLARSSVLNDHYQPPAPPAPPASPAPASHGGLIPDDYDPLSADDPSGIGLPPRAAIPPAQRDANPFAPPPEVRARPAAGVPTPQPSRPGPAPARPSNSAPSPAPAGGNLSGLEAMLAGAGLGGASVTPELAHAFGEILRVVVSGVMDVMQARQRIKNEFRMRMTSFRPAANNPLKFSANVDDALHNLLVKRNPAYLGPVEAFEDAFEDLRNHQVATLAGVRVAFEAMLAEFDPERLQEEFDQQMKKGALISVPARLRYWDLYRDRFSGMVKDPDTTFRELFGDEFTKAYEEQLDRLKAQGRRGVR
jgi:type VI secretion system FHA domain protein